MRHETEMTSKDETLKNFMLEMFDFDGLRKIGVYGKDIKRKDYQAQADRICKYFGFKTAFEYGKDSVKAHLTYANRPTDTPFVEKFGGIYE